MTQKVKVIRCFGTTALEDAINAALPSCPGGRVVALQTETNNICTVIIQWTSAYPED